METLIFILVGVSFGSFANVLIYRIPAGKSVLLPKSACGYCKKPIPFYFNIPVLGFLILRGQTACCKKPLSAQYIVVEILGGLLFWLALVKFGYELETFAIGVAFIALLAMSYIDFKYLVAPDSLNLLAFFCAILGANSFLLGFTNGLFFIGGATLLRFALSYFLKKEAMGEADILVIGTMGAVLGLMGGFLAIFLSAIVALPAALYLQHVKKVEPKLPFIPFLFMGLLLSLIFGDFLLQLWW